MLHRKKTPPEGLNDLKLKENKISDREFEIFKIFKDSKAIITDSHIVYASNKHGSAYVNKDAVYPHTARVSRLCQFIAEDFKDEEIDAVVGPVVGGVSLSQWTAHHLSVLQGKEVLAISSDKIEEESGEHIVKRLKNLFSEEALSSVEWLLSLISKEMKASTSFVVKRGQDKLITGKKILVVEDVLTTGGSVKKVVEAIKKINCEIIGVGALCNRGNISEQEIGNVPVLKALIDINLDAYDEADCPYCKAGIPINIEVGKGKKFLEDKNIDPVFLENIENKKVVQKHVDSIWEAAGEATKHGNRG